MADLSTTEIFAALADLGVTGDEAGAKGAQTSLKHYISYCERGVPPGHSPSVAPLAGG
jgi:hypothetical protein